MTVVDWQGYKDYCETISMPPKMPLVVNGTKLEYRAIR